ncbi:MAG TPA: ferritin-like domain-containing protein, partial [Acidimicrobiales bacterium]
MPTDDRSLHELLEESEDLHADAMRTTKSALRQVVQQSDERRAHGDDTVEERAEFNRARRTNMTGALTALAAVGAFGVAAGMLGALDAAPAFADAASDVSAAQTAASIENLAIAVYGKAAALPFMQTIPAPAGPTVAAFVTKTVAQHKDHLQAFNAAATRLGGKAQTGIDTVVYNAVVAPELPKLTSPLVVAQFANELETVAAATYAAATSAVSDKQLRSTFASIMGVESQHAAVLSAVAALLQGGAPQLITVPVDPALLPAAAGSVGFPQSFVQTTSGRPRTE